MQDYLNRGTFSRLHHLERKTIHDLVHGKASPKVIITEIDVVRSMARSDNLQLNDEINPPINHTVH